MSPKLTFCAKPPPGEGGEGRVVAWGVLAGPILPDADVIEAVTFARAHGLLVAVRGGGHNVAGAAVCGGGLVIDLSLMKGLRVDPETSTAWAQPGLLWGEFDHETQAFSLATTGGIVTHTGI